MKSKKGQMGIGEAPSIVLIVGLTFLVMATVALIASEYNDSFPADETFTGTNEAVTRTAISSAAGATLNGALQENAQSFTLGSVRNATASIANGNFSLSSSGVLTNVSTLAAYGDSLFVNYTNLYSGVSANVTTDLQVEIANNTSIAGIILTISLVGIVLSILVGVFLTIRAKRI